MPSSLANLDTKRAVVIGSGPNGLSAAITLAQDGVATTVYEAAATLGGAASTAAITLPDFHHDLGSSVFPMGAASPFFQSLPLGRYGSVVLVTSGTASVAVRVLLSVTDPPVLAHMDP